MKHSSVTQKSEEQKAVYKRDRALAARAKAGDEQARNELVALYHPLSLKIAYSFRQYVEDPEDLSQEALLRLTKRIKDYRGSETEFITFAWNVMLYRVMNVVTRRKKRAERIVSLYQAIGEDEGELVMILEDKYSPPVSDGVTTEAKEYVRKHVEVLKKKERTIIEEVLAGRSMGDIADTIGKSKVYVMRHYDLALKRLKHSIERSNETKGVESLLS